MDGRHSRGLGGASCACAAVLVCGCSIASAGFPEGLNIAPEPSSDQRCRGTKTNQTEGFLSFDIRQGRERAEVGEGGEEENTEKPFHLTLLNAGACTEPF